MQDGLELVGGQRVKANEGLVKQKQLRCVDQCAYEDELLAHAVRVAADLVAEVLGNLQTLGELGDACRACVGGYLKDVGDVGEVLDARHEVVDVGVIRHVGDLALCRDGVSRYVDAADADRARIDGLDAGDGADERCLAGAVVANEAVDVAGLDGERQVTYGEFLAVALLVMGDLENRGAVGDGHGSSERYVIVGCVSCGSSGRERKGGRYDCASSDLYSSPCFLGRRPARLSASRNIHST